MVIFKASPIPTGVGLCFVLCHCLNFISFPDWFFKVKAILR